MPKTAMIRDRTEPELKSDVEEIFKELGMSATEVINLFIRYGLKKGCPLMSKYLNMIATEERCLKKVCGQWQKQRGKFLILRGSERERLFSVLLNLQRTL